VTVILVRLLWVPIAAWLPRFLSPSLRARDPLPSWPNLFLIGWIGMRGIVSLAAALALPLVTPAGNAFPFRAEIILITFFVILATLVLQGLTLPLVLGSMNIEIDRSLEHEERGAREHAASAALARLDTVASEAWPVAEHIERMRIQYDRRLKRYADSQTMDAECTKESSDAYRRLRHEMLTAERLALIGLRNGNAISDEILHRLEHELDAEALRSGVGELRVSEGIDDAKPLEKSG
jgi:CPA1 family monovalent cation:H+ antiporter